MFLTGLSLPVLSDNPEPVTFRATYKIYNAGMEIAESEREVGKSAANEYYYRAVSHTTGFISMFRKDRIVEQSQWKFVNNELQPVKYTYSRTKSKKDKEVSVFFDRSRKIIANRINDNTIELPLAEDALDKLLYQYAIMHDLRNGRFPAQYTIADARKIKTYRFEAAGEEKIATPLGELHTIKISRIDDNRKLVFWCAPQLEYLPVQIEDTREDGAVRLTVLQKVEGL